MIYFESLKIKYDYQQNQKPLNLKLTKNSVNYLTSSNINYLNNFYNFLSNCSNYESGNCFVDEYDITKLKNNKRINYLNNKLSFCDDNLLFNSKWTIKKIIDNVSKFYKLKDINKEMIIDLVDPSFKNEFNNKIYNLESFQKIKLKLILSLLQDKKIIIVNLFDDVDIDQQQFFELNEIIRNINLKFNIEFLVFTKIELNDNQFINLDSSEHYHNNSTFTISPKNYTYIKFKTSIFQCLTLYFKQYWFLIILFMLINASLITWTIFSFSIQTFLDQITQQNSLITFIKDNKVIWNVISYISYFISVTWSLFFWIVISYKYKNYYLFLKHEQVSPTITNTMNAIIFFLIYLLEIGIAYLINIIFLQSKFSQLKNTNFTISLFIYLIYTIIIVTLLIIDINNRINSTTFKNAIVKLFIY